jgi:predicted CDP-diglyceride synthetase/phosphatidate cytidylyltransferase
MMASKPMPEKDPSTYSLITYAWVVIMSGWGGVVSYLRKRKLGIIPRFSFTGFIGELATSAFSGMVTFFLCESANLDAMLSAALIAISGHMGSKGIFFIESYLRNRLHIDGDDQ